MKTTVLREIVSRCVARRNCIERGNREWEIKHTETIEALEKELPSGSGIDNGTQVDVEASGPQRLVLQTSFHHMDDGGCYDGWTEHTITVRPDLLFGFTLSISGRDRNQIKEYLNDVFSETLAREIETV